MGKHHHKHASWMAPMLGMQSDHGDRGHDHRGRGRGRRRGWDADVFGPDGPFGARGPFGPDGPFGMTGPWGPGGPRHGRRARRGNVRNAILHALAENEMNGYQIIGFVEDHTDGAWRPSPGAIYPALSQLEDEGLITQISLDGHKAFQLTEAGRAAVAEQADAPKPWEFAQAASWPGPTSKELWHQFRQLAMALQAAARTGEQAVHDTAADIVRRARREIYNLLAEADESDE